MSDNNHVNTEIRHICCDDLFQSYYQTWKKLTTASNQKVFFKNCVQRRVLPHNIHEQSKFTVSFDDSATVKQCETEFLFAASRCLNIILKSVTSKCRRLHKSLNFIRESLHIVKDSDTLTHVNQLFSKAMNRLAEKTKATHEKKFTKLVADTYIPLEEKPSPPQKLNKRKKYKKKKKRTRSRKNPHKFQKDLIKGDDMVRVKDNMIINLSNRELSPNHKELLTLGDSFSPTPGQINMNQYHDDIDQFTNSVRWGYKYFKNPREVQNPYKDLERDVIPKKKTMKAPKTQSNSLELYLELTVNDLKNIDLFRTSHDNLTSEHRQALKDLNTWDDIIVRKFDKGKGWIIDSKESYVSRMEENLHDTNTFEKITGEENVLENINDKIFTWMEEHKEQLTPKLCKAIIPEISRPGYNYGNYKSHKPEKNFPLRMITSGCGSPVQPLSKYVEHHLYPLVKELEHVIIDTRHFLQKLDEFNTNFNGDLDKIILASWDVEAMFPSIDNTMGIEACRELLDQRAVLEPPTSTIIEALSIVLENNISYFNNNIYKQIKGTAMGPNHACSYADIAMSKFDKIINSNRDYTLTMWARFRDDIFTTWIGTIDELNEFTDWINTLHPSIKFKLESYSTEKINYLDCEVYKNKDRICTSMYSKPSDNFAYMVPTSCHPTHIAKNIPYGVATRCKRLCTEEAEFDRHTTRLIQNFKDRGYSEKFVRNEFDKVKVLNRNDLIYSKDPLNIDNVEHDITVKSNRCFPLVTDFNPKLPNIGYILNKHKYLLELDSDIRGFLNPDKIFASFRRCNSLGDLLVNSRFPKKGTGSTSDNGCFKCTKRFCNLCKNYLFESKDFTSPHTSNSYTVKEHITCTDEYVIYMILDTVCQRAYVGRTENTLTNRWTCHKSHIKKGFQACEVAVHYNSTDPSNHQWKPDSIDITLPCEISIMLIDKVVPEVWDNPDTLFEKLVKKEKYWQNQLNTISVGLNLRNERQCKQVRVSKK